MRQSRVLLIGIDGATFDIINPLILGGKLPNFQKLLDEGVHGTLKSGFPLTAATGWASLVTGKNAGKHNIYDFYKCNAAENRYQVIKSNMIKSEKLWNILDKNGLKSIVVNVPVTYPPEPINGVMIGGMLSSRNNGYTFPRILSDELNKKDYVIDLYQYYCKSLSDYFNLALKTITNRHQAFRDILKTIDWNFALITFTVIDRLESVIWWYRELIEHIYRELDRLIGQMIQENDDGNTYIMIVSEYGFKDVKKKFFVNEWLWNLGLLSKKISTEKATIPNFLDEYFAHKIEDNNFITNIFTRTGITKDNIRKIIPEIVCETIKKATPSFIRKIFPKENLVIDWENTQAYLPSYSAQGIKINLAGREPFGIVQPGEEYEQVRDKVIRELYRLKDPFTFHNVIKSVYRKDEIFSGEYAHNAPDVIFETHNYDYYLDPNKRTCKDCIGHADDDFPIYTHHKPQGIFIMNGPAAKKMYEVKNMNIVDIAPNILHMLNIPVPGDMDGHVYHEMFNTDDEHEQNPIIFDTSDYFDYYQPDLGNHIFKEKSV